MLKRISALLLPLAVGWLLVGAISADEQIASITLQPGHTALTWSGAEPYAIANFEGTPITKIHRFDPIRQRWLSHAIGQSDATLPELHLLPRVQYLLKSDAAHELTIPNPLADIDPLARLRFPPTPDDPLRFEAYWPNEDSPLEDLVVLRGEDERLSVEAWVEGGEGEIEVYWLLDGRLNHRGPASEDVELSPGKHDDARLTVVDETGQIAVIELPRVVKLPPLELPEMVYGLFTHMMSVREGCGQWSWCNLAAYRSLKEVGEGIRHIARAGFNVIEVEYADLGGISPSFPDDDEVRNFRTLDSIVATARRYEVDLFVLLQDAAYWNESGDVNDRRLSGPADMLSYQNEARRLAARFPQFRYWMLSHESNLGGFFPGVDPWLDAKRVRAAALGIWYENPSAVTVGPGLVPAFDEHRTAWFSPGSGRGVAEADSYLQALYDHGFFRWIDILSYHPGRGFREQTEQVRTIMVRNGDSDRPLWVTSLLIPSGVESLTEDERSVEMAVAMEWLTRTGYVSGILIYNYRQKSDWHRAFDDGLYLGLVEHEFVNGQPVPTPTWNAVVEFIQQRESTKK